MNAMQTALDVCFIRTAVMHVKRERLHRLADEHYGHGPDTIHWSHVGDLGRLFIATFG